MSNSIFTLAPYWQNGAWVFDDEAKDIRSEPFVAGIPEIINEYIKDIPDAARGFRLLFSIGPFPGSQDKLTWLREESEGNWYKSEKLGCEGWLCPCMYQYLDPAPKEIYFKCEEK